MPSITPIRHDGNESLFLAVEMSLISTAAGSPLHVHAEGLRGTGKTTVMRWARTIAPEITRIKGCLFQCDPDNPHCPTHAHKARDSGTGEGPFPERETVPMPFVEIGHGAKLGTILGSIDLARLTDPEKPQAALLPGSIPMANRGIIFIDEINRLAETAPEITDVLLSVMGTKPGRVKIEEVGLPPCEIEISSSVWAASNPDEDPGPLEEIRKQLADRFDLVIPVQRPSSPEVVEKLLLGKHEKAEAQAPLHGDFLEKARRLKSVKVPDHILRYMAQLYVQRNVESLRAIEALEQCSRVLAAIRGKTQVSFDEVATVLPLVLRHRVEPLVLSEILKDLELRKAAAVQPRPSQDDTQQGRTPGEPTGSPGEPSALQPSPDNPARSQSEPRDTAPRASPCTSEPQNREDPPGTTRGTTPESCRLPQMNRQPTLLDKVLARYRGFLGKGSLSPSPTSRRWREENHTTPGEKDMPDPARTKPISPPDPARRIAYLSWEEIILPPEWRDSPR